MNVIWHGTPSVEYIKKQQETKKPLVFKSFQDLHNHLKPKKSKRPKQGAEMVSVTMWIDGAAIRHKSKEVVLFKETAPGKYKRSVFKSTVAEKYITNLRTNVIHVQGRHAINNACVPLLR